MPSLFALMLHYITYTGLTSCSPQPHGPHRIRMSAIAEQYSGLPTFRQDLTVVRKLNAPIQSAWLTPSLKQTLHFTNTLLAPPFPCNAYSRTTLTIRRVVRFEDIRREYAVYLAANRYRQLGQSVHPDLCTDLSTISLEAATIPLLPAWFAVNFAASRV